METRYNTITGDKMLVILSFSDPAYVGCCKHCEEDHRKAFQATAVIQPNGEREVYVDCEDCSVAEIDMTKDYPEGDDKSWPPFE